MRFDKERAESPRPTLSRMFREWLPGPLGGERKGDARGRQAKRARPPRSLEKKPPSGIKIGLYLAGFGALELFKQYAFWPLSSMYNHMAIIGETGSGKSSTVWTVLDGLVKGLTRRQRRRGGDLTPQVLVLDANADPNLARLAGATMHANGLGRFAVFPAQRINAWPDDPRAIYNRLLELIPLAEDRSGASYYADATAIVLDLACHLPPGPPKSTRDLLKRLKYQVLLDAYGEEELEGITEQMVEATRMRCRRVCGEIGSAFDGERELRNLDGAYFGVDAMVMGHSTIIATRMLISHIEHYVRYEKHPDRPCILIIDEFASLQGEVDLSTLIEQARKLNVCVILVSQTVAGIGGPTQVKRILHNSGAVVVHRTREWRELESVIGIETVPEFTFGYGEEGEPDGERVRMVKRALVDQGELLGLPLGQIWVFKGNEAMRVEVELPSMRRYKEFVFPEAEELFDLFAQPVEDRPVDPPPPVDAPREPDEVFKRRWEHARATEEVDEEPEFNFLVKDSSPEASTGQGEPVAHSTPAEPDPGAGT